MAASCESKCWKETMKNLPVCRFLQKNRSNKNSLQAHQTEAKNIVSIHGSDLFIWDYADSSILHCNLRNFTSSETETKTSEKSTSGASNRDENIKKGYQRLVLSNCFGLDVEGISVNRCCSHILAWGKHGIRAIELPRRWGAGAVFEGGKECISCRITIIGERNFHGNHSVTVRQVKWHPGSQTHTHVAVLTSDNVYSVFDISDPDEAVSTVVIDSTDASTSSPGKSFISSALGESAVAFDFGSAITLKPKPRPFGKNSTIPTIEVWPVYCVRGNGDVMLLYSHLSNYSSLSLPVYGPLPMYPPAEDNYGVDACYILCLDTPSPVLAISTCDGRLHHCVQMEEAGEDGEEDSSPSPGNSLYKAIPKPFLYVVESVELELCLGSGSPLDQSGVDDFFNCPVHLQNDINSHDRYYCVHKAGVHSVALPWMSVVQQYFLVEADNLDLDLSEDKECVVEHLFCTKPLHSSPTSPVLGVDVISDPVLGPTLVILSSDFEFTALSIGLQYQSSLPSMLQDKMDILSSSSSTRSQSQPFSQFISQILQRKTSNPLIRSNNQKEPSQQECFQLLSRATQILREEYIEKQDHAREEIDSRVSILRELKENQLQEIGKLKGTTRMLREHTRIVADKLNTCSENYDTIRQRVDTVLHKLQCRVPNLSEAERNLLRDLKGIQSCLQRYKKDLDAVSTKMEYQERQRKKTTSIPSPVLQEKQLNQIRTILKEEANEIEDLKKDISQFCKEIS